MRINKKIMLTMWEPLAAVLLLCAPEPAPLEESTPEEARPRPSEEPWASLAGSGLLTLSDTATLAPGRFTVGLALDNRDRDPLGLDLFDYSATWAVGVTPHLELFGHHVFSRVVSLPELPALPPPPLDLIVARRARVPSRPYYSLYSPVPYVNNRGTARFEADVPGDTVMGLKLRLRGPHRRRPALALGAEVKAPGTRDMGDLQSGSGTGGVDATGRINAEWRSRRHAVVASVAYTRVGAPAAGDRLIVEGAGGETTVTDLPLTIPDRLDLGLGLRRVLSPRLAAALEGTTVLEVGRRTPTLDAARPVDVLAGVQMRWGHARLTAALRYHGNGLPSGRLRPSPLAGLLDLTGVQAGDLESYLRAVAAGGALVHLRPGSQRVLAVEGTLPAPPAGARLIPAAYRIRSEHQVGFVAFWGWAF